MTAHLPFSHTATIPTLNGFPGPFCSTFANQKEGDIGRGLIIVGTISL
jgi:hypothetical protein